MSDTNQQKPYHQQTNESSRWYGRFYNYMLLGSGRSLLAAHNVEREKAGKSPTKSVPGAWDAAAATWQWIDRAAHWDAEIRLREHSRWAARREEFRERQWKLAERLLTRAEEMLEKPLATVDKEGNPYERWTFRDIATFIAEGSRLSRQSAEVWEGDLNAAVALVYKYYDDLPKALSLWKERKDTSIDISAKAKQSEAQSEALESPPS